MGHLIQGGGLAQPQVKTGQLQVQPLADSQMQGITSPQRRHLSQAEPGRDLEILRNERQAVQALFAQHPKSLPGLLRFLRCDRASAHLESQGRRQFRGYPGRNEPGLTGVLLEKREGCGGAGFVHQGRHHQGCLEIEAPQ